MLKINGLTKIYGRSDVKAVDDLSLEVESGEIFGFIGPNGAGKSTTIKCVTGITGFNAGTIEVNGFDVRKNPIEAKRSIGYVSDSHVVYDQLTGRNTLTLWRRFTASRIRNRTNPALKITSTFSGSKTRSTSR